MIIAGFNYAFAIEVRIFGFVKSDPSFDCFA